MVGEASTLAQASFCVLAVDWGLSAFRPCTPARLLCMGATLCCMYFLLRSLEDGAIDVQQAGAAKSG